MKKPLLFILTLLLFSANSSWAKGPLDSDVAEFSTNVLTPILVRNGLCNSHQNCREKEYFFCVSWEAVSCGVYGITDERLIKEIFLAVLNSGLKIHSFSFWSSKYQEKSFFEKPLLNYTNRMGDK